MRTGVDSPKHISEIEEKMENAIKAQGLDDVRVQMYHDEFLEEYALLEGLSW